MVRALVSRRASIHPPFFCYLVSLVIFLAYFRAASALGPHEVVLVINAGSADSLEIGHHYAHLRGIPSQNIVYVDLPRDYGGPRSEITPQQFEDFIYKPVSQVIEERRLADHILAWVYSAGFPVRVLTQPPVSINGATFVRAQFPGEDAIKMGSYLSPLYRGPDKPDEKGLPPVSIQDFAVALKEKMPLPSFLLAYTAGRGLSVEETLENLRRTARADGTRPKGTFYYHVSDDTRSKARRWQFEGAAVELRQLGFPVNISSNPPAPQTPLAGLMLGIANAHHSWGSFQAGSIVDNLTSFGAEFHHHEQVRLTHWLREGASIASGTVIEPFANWAKFPHARIFSHYARGCSALESYFQAVRSPLQLLIVGDPLAKPWGAPLPLVLVQVDGLAENATGTVTFAASTFAMSGINFLYLLNGRAIPAPGSATGVRIDTRQLEDGAHELIVAGYSQGPVRQIGVARQWFTVSNRGRFCRLTSEMPVKSADYYRPLRLRIESAPGVTSLVVSVHERELIQIATSNTSTTLEIDPKEIGLGPVPLRAIAKYADGFAVRSKPLTITIAKLNRAPLVQSVAIVTSTTGRARYQVQVEDPENDPITITWFKDALEKPPTEITATQEGWLVPATQQLLSPPLKSIPPETREIVFRMKTTAERRETGPLVGGLAWDLKDEKNYAYFGWHWAWHGWVAGRVRDGQFEPLHARGVPLTPTGKEDLSLLMGGDALVITVAGEHFLRDARIPLRPPFALVGGPVSWTLQNLFVNIEEVKPPTALKGVWVRASDPSASTWFKPPP